MKDDYHPTAQPFSATERAVSDARPSGWIERCLDEREEVEARAAQAARPGTAEWIAAVQGRWWVLHCRARNEKRIAEYLDERRVNYYLPLVRVQRTYTKSKVTFDLPLFQGYVFLCGEHDACEAALRSNRVANIIVVNDQNRLREELMQLCRVLASGRSVELYPALQVGQRCRIVSGALKGVEGVVIRRGQRCRMYLAISTLGQSAVVEVDAAMLEATN